MRVALVTGWPPTLGRLVVRKFFRSSVTCERHRSEGQILEEHDRQQARLVGAGWRALCPVVRRPHKPPAVYPPATRTPR